MTAKEVAESTGYSESTIRLACAQGKIKGARRRAPINESSSPRLWEIPVDSALDLKLKTEKKKKNL